MNENLLNKYIRKDIAKYISLDKPLIVPKITVDLIPINEDKIKLNTDIKHCNTRQVGTHLDENVNGLYNRVLQKI